jgi:methionyl aminopeptidase
MVVAIEPFSTDGRGKVGDGGRGTIYRIVRDRKAPGEVAETFDKIKREFGQFPFAGRWCEKLDSDAGLHLSKMVRLGMIMSYPVLTEVGKGTVAQAEHSVLVTKDGCRILT